MGIFNVMNIKSLIKKIDSFVLILFFLTIIGCFLYSQNMSWPMSDIGRELYFPQLVLEGKVLYKDIFNLFGPFSYLFNAVLYKIFGVGYVTMYYFGYILAITMILSIYTISKEMLDKNTAIIIALFSISIGVTTTQNFNYYVPYAYSILYGMIMFIWSAYCYIKYLRTKDAKQLLFSTFFAGVAIANKYEFALYVALLVTLIIREFFIKKQIGAKIFVSSMLLLLLPTAVCFGFLFYQGLTFGDIFNAIGMIKSVVLTDSYRYFYKSVGALFSADLFVNSLIYFVLFVLSMTMVYVSEKLFKLKSKYAYISAAFAIYYIYYLFINFGSNSVFAFISYFVLFLIIKERKNLTEEALFWSVAAFLASYKVFFFCFMKYYGVFFISIMLLALLILLGNYPKLKKYITYYLIILTLFTFYTSIALRSYTAAGLRMDQPRIKTFYDSTYKINKVIKYIEEQTFDNDKVVIYPEGLTINFITNRKTENIFYALTPAYLELFEEDKLIKYFEENKPEYFIFTNDNMSEYGKRQMCKNYAGKFCKFIRENYTMVKSFGYINDPEPYEIYKKN